MIEARELGAATQAGAARMAVASGKDRIVLKANSFNFYRFEVLARQAGVMAFAEPFSSNWRAFVDGARQTIYRANGYEQAIWLPPGS